MNQRYEKGIQVMREHLGPQADDYVEAIKEVSPQFAQLNVEFPFGDLYGNENSSLNQKTRELVTVGALTVMGHALPQLKIHVGCALRCGASQEEITEVITQMIAYCGFPAATNAIMTAKEVFKEEGLL